MSTVKSKKIQVGTSATSTDNFTIYQPSTPDGTLRIGQGNADSPTEVGQFNSNGYKPVQPVACSMYMASDTDISEQVWTKIPYDTVRHDTASIADTTNKRITPNVAGYYLVNMNVSLLDNLDSGQAYFYTRFYKNGSVYRDGMSIRGNGTDKLKGDSSFHATIQMYFNGTTDYVEAYVYYSSSAPTIDSGTARGHLEAILIAQA